MARTPGLQGLVRVWWASIAVLRITYTIVGVPYYIYTVVYHQTPILIIKAPVLGVPLYPKP